MKMKNKEEIIRQKIGDTFEDALNVLKIYGHDLHIFLPEDKDWEKPKNNSLTVKVQYPYQSIDLFVGEDIIKNFNNKDYDMGSYLLHEACHVLLWRYAYLAESRYINQKQLLDEEERIVSQLTNAVEDLLDK